MYEQAMDTIFRERWGLWAAPAGVTDDRAMKVIAISVGLGCLFNEDRDAERRWMETPRNGWTPLAMVFAGRFDDVMSMVDNERFPPNCT